MGKQLFLFVIAVAVIVTAQPTFACHLETDSGDEAMNVLSNSFCPICRSDFSCPSHNAPPRGPKGPQEPRGPRGPRS